jgi:hypothetical protein
MVIGMTIDVAENPVRALRTAALGALALVCRSCSGT